MIAVNIDSEELREAQRVLGGMPGKLDSVMKRSMRRLKNVLASDMSRQISQEYYVKRSRARSRMKADIEGMSVVLRVRDSRPTLKSFMMKPSKHPLKRRPAGYLYAGIKRGTLYNIPGGFVFPRNDVPAVRISRGRHGSIAGLEFQRGPSIAELAAEKEVLPGVIEKAQSQMLQQMRYWTRREMQK